MNKYRLGIGLLFLWCILIPLAAAHAESATQQSISLFLEGNKLQPDVPPKVVGGRTLVPIRVIAEGFGSKVGWDPVEKKVSISSDQVKLSMWIGKKMALVNGKEVAMDVPPRIDQNRTLVPLRFVGESLGTTVGWEPSTSSVVINQTYTLSANGKKLNEKVFKWKDELYLPLQALSPYIGAVFQSSKDEKKDRLVYRDQNVDLVDQGQKLLKLKKLDAGWVIPESILEKEFQAQIDLRERNRIELVKVSELQAVKINNGKVIIQSSASIPAQHFLMSGPDRLVIDLPNMVIGKEIKSIVNFKDGMGIVNKWDTVTAASSKESTALTLESLGGTKRTSSVDNPFLQQPNESSNKEIEESDEEIKESNEQLTFEETQGEANEQENTNSNNGVIREIRFSQFSLEPQTVRVVIELNQKTEYEMDQTPSGLEVTFKPLPKKDGFLIILDPGHGGSDPGAKGVNGNWEKELTLSVSRLLRDELKKYKGLQVFETRTEDVYPTLQERVQMANDIQADVFLSIHANSFKPETRGTETYYYHDASEDLARVLHKHLLEATGFPDRKVKKSGFYVIKNTTMPSSLVELGFLTNEQENSLMLDPAFQAKVAKALAQAIYEYYTSEADL